MQAPKQESFHQYPIGNATRLQTLLATQQPSDRFLAFMGQAPEVIAEQCQNMTVTFDLSTWIILNKHESFLQALACNTVLKSRAQQAIAIAILSANKHKFTDDGLMAIAKWVFDIDTENFSAFLIALEKADGIAETIIDEYPNIKYPDTTLTILSTAFKLHPMLLHWLPSSMINDFIASFTELTTVYENEFCQEFLRVLFSPIVNRTTLSNTSLSQLVPLKRINFSGYESDATQPEFKVKNSIDNVLIQLLQFLNSDRVFYIESVISNSTCSFRMDGDTYRFTVSDLVTHLTDWLIVLLLRNNNLRSIISTATINDWVSSGSIDVAVTVLEQCEANQLPMPPSYLLATKSIEQCCYLLDCIASNDPHVVRRALATLFNFPEDILVDTEKLTTLTCWLIARCIREGQTENVDHLVIAAKHLVRFSMQFEQDPSTQATLLTRSNELYCNAFQQGHGEAGLVLADHLYDGFGMLENREKAIEIYAFIAEHHPDLITATAILRLVNAKYPAWEAAFKRYEKLVADSVRCQTLVDVQKPSNNVTVGLLSKQSILFNNPVVATKEKVKQLQSRAIDCFNDLLTQLKPILELDIREQKNHQLLPSLQTAHMLMVHILFTQKDVVSKADWLRLFPRSVTAAWNYDQLPAGDPTLLSILNGIKMMSRGDIARAVFSTTVKTFATVDAKNTDEKQPIHRSHSMPMLSK